MAHNSHTWHSGDVIPASLLNTIETDLAAAAVVAGGNVFTGNQQINGGLGVGNPSDPKQPVNFTVSLDGSTVRGSGSVLDKVAQQQNIVVTGDFTGDTGSNPGFLWGENKYLTIGSGAADGKGLTDVTTSLIEVNVGSPTGVNFSGAVRALELAAQINGAAAGSHIGTMETLRVGAPKRVNGATGGSVDNAYSLFVEGVDAADVGATAALSVFVSKGISRFGGRVDVQGTVQSTAGGLSLIGGLTTPGASLILNDNSGGGGGHAQVKLGGSGSVFAVTSSGGANVLQMDNGGNVNLAGGIGLFGTSAVTSKPVVTGSRSGNAALDSLLNTLAGYGLITNSTTA